MVMSYKNIEVTLKAMVGSPDVIDVKEQIFIWMKVLNFAKPVTGIVTCDLARNSLNPEINISLVSIIIAAITS